MTDETHDLAAADVAPSVARAEAAGSPALIAGGFGVLAIALFLVLNGQRQAEASALTTPVANAALLAPAPPLQLPDAAPTAPPPPPSPVSAPILPPPSFAGGTGLERRKAPAVVVDLGGGGAPIVLAQAAAAPGGAAAPAAAATENASTLGGLSAQMRFGGESAAIATPGGDLGLMVPQGAVIPAVLETAINSDLPGYTRAVVSRDVYSFDGRNVLIPRGSRLIGQYRSATALGQSRAFVIWSRVVRPDGVSVQIGSPGTDELGRGGLTGEVQRHFLRRFGGSILLSVLNAGAAAIGGAPNTQIAIGSPAQANAAASSAQMGENIPPTIKVPQGEGIRIFVARDLDFSAVGPMR
jgi:type IV secretion system protein VirB10